MVEQLFIVTGGSGFVGANFVRLLNSKGIRNIVIVDNYNEQKFRNIRELYFLDFINYTKGLEFVSDNINQILENGYSLAAIFHIGANADVLVADADSMLEANFEHSKFYLELSAREKCPLIYASSSAVYGHSPRSSVNDESVEPHNVYAWSKWIFDKIVRMKIKENPAQKIVGLRLFNTFGKGEYHKAKNASLPYRFFELIKDKGFIDLFDEKIERDYIWVQDVANSFYEAYSNINVGSGIYNLGTGNPISHERLAMIVSAEFVKKGIYKETDSLVRKIPMPDELKSKFQFHTQAENIEGWIKQFAVDNETKIKKYINELIDETYGSN